MNRPVAAARRRARRQSPGRTRSRPSAPLRRSIRGRRSRRAGAPPIARSAAFRRAVSTRSRSSNGVGMGAKTPRDSSSVRLYDRPAPPSLLQDQVEAEHDEEHRRRRTEQPRKIGEHADVGDASCSIVPQLAIGSGNPRPTYDSVASATMNAGTSSVICDDDEAARRRQQMPREQARVAGAERLRGRRRSPAAARSARSRARRAR